MMRLDSGIPSPGVSPNPVWPALKGRLRGLVKSGCALTLHASGLERVVALGRGRAHAPLVIGYHRIVANFAQSAGRSIAPQLTSAAMFERHLDWIGKRYDFVSLDELVAVLDGTAARRRPVAAVTFDDGYRDLYHNALPVLMRKGIPGAVFVVTNLTGGTGLLAHDALFLLFSRLLATHRRRRRTEHWLQLLPEDIAAPLAPHAQAVPSPFVATRVVLEQLDQHQIARLLAILNPKVGLAQVAQEDLQLLDWDLLRRMAAQGITIGSHTQTHALLSKVPPALARAELEGSRQALETELGVAVRHLAYPDGRFDEAVVAAAVAAGYGAGYTICRHRDPRHPLLTIPRTMLWEHSCLDAAGRFSPAILSCQTHGIFDPGTRCQQIHRA